MRIEFTLPEGVRLCSFSYAATDQPLRFKACLAGQPVLGEDGILRPHAIEVAWGETPQAAIDNTFTRLRDRESEIAKATPVKRTVPDIELDLSFLG